jgi:hypothetical protein
MPVVQAFQDARRELGRRLIDVWRDERSKLRTGVADDNSAKPYVKHRRVIARVAGDNHTLGVDSPTADQEIRGGALVGIGRQYVQVAIRAVDNTRALTGRDELVLQPVDK